MHSKLQNSKNPHFCCSHPHIRFIPSVTVENVTWNYQFGFHFCLSLPSACWCRRNIIFKRGKYVSLYRVLFPFLHFKWFTDQRKGYKEGYEKFPLFLPLVWTKGMILLLESETRDLALWNSRRIGPATYPQTSVVDKDVYDHSTSMLGSSYCTEEQPRTSVLHLQNEVPRLHRRRQRLRQRSTDGQSTLVKMWSGWRSSQVWSSGVLPAREVVYYMVGSFSSHHEMFACKPWCCWTLRETEEKIIKERASYGERIKPLKTKLVHVWALGSQKLPSASAFSGMAPTPLLCLCFNYHWLSVACGWPHLCSWITMFVLMEYHENVVCKWNKQEL